MEKIGEGEMQMTKNEKAAMLAELKGLYEQYHRISPKDCERQRITCAEIGAVQYVLHAGLNFSMEKDEIMELFKKLDKDAELEVTSEKMKGCES